MPSKKTTTSINPATGKIIGKTPENTIEELAQAISLARIAQHEWAKLSFHERAQHLFAIRDYIVENADKISDVISKAAVGALATAVLNVFTKH